MKLIILLILTSITVHGQNNFTVLNLSSTCSDSIHVKVLKIITVQSFEKKDSLIYREDDNVICENIDFLNYSVQLPPKKSYAITITDKHTLKVKYLFIQTGNVVIENPFFIRANFDNKNIMHIRYFEKDKMYKYLIVPNIE